MNHVLQHYAQVIKSGVKMFVQGGIINHSAKQHPMSSHVQKPDEKPNIGQYIAPGPRRYDKNWCIAPSNVVGHDSTKAGEHCLGAAPRRGGRKSARMSRNAKTDLWTRLGLGFASQSSQGWWWMFHSISVSSVKAVQSTPPRACNRCNMMQYDAMACLSRLSHHKTKKRVAFCKAAQLFLQRQRDHQGSQIFPIRCFKMLQVSSSI